MFKDILYECILTLFPKSCIARAVTEKGMEGMLAHTLHQ